MMSNAIGSRLHAVFDTLSEHLTLDDKKVHLNPTNFLVATTACLIACYILKYLSRHVCGYTESLAGKRITYNRNGQITSIRWQTPEGTTIVHATQGGLQCDVEYLSWDAEKKRWAMMESSPKINLPSELQHLSQGGQLKWFRDKIVGINRFGEAAFHTLEWQSSSKGGGQRISARYRMNQHGLLFDSIEDGCGHEYCVGDISMRVEMPDFSWNSSQPFGPLEKNLHLLTMVEISEAYFKSLPKDSAGREVSITRGQAVAKMLSDQLEQGAYFTLSPSCVRSQIDDRVTLSEFWWGVCVISHGGGLGGHAQIIIEGCDHGSYFANMFELNGPNTVSLKDLSNKQISFSHRSELFKKTVKEVTILFQELLRMKKHPPEKFSQVGRHSFLGGGADNCYTFAENMLGGIGIYLEKNRGQLIFSAPTRCLASANSIKRSSKTSPDERGKVM